MVNAEKLQALIDTAKALIDKQATESDSEFFVWHEKVMRALAGIYGKQSDQYMSFEQINFKATWLGEKHRNTVLILGRNERK